MATNLALDDALIQEAQALGQHKTKKDAVTAALTEYIGFQKRRALLELLGKVPFDKKYDYKRERRKR